MTTTLAANEQTLLDAIAGTQAKMLSTLCEHVAIPTGQGFKQGLDEYRALVEKKLMALGAEISEIPGEARPAWVWPKVEAKWIPSTLVARSQHGDKATGPRVLIVGHLDTVHDPNGAFRELTIESDGHIATGPGAVDMKGGIVIALAALEALKNAGVLVNWTVALNSDEETGSFHSANALRQLAREHDYGIVLEPALTNGAMAISRMGSSQFMIEVHGKSAHVGRDFKRGISAVTRLAELVAELGTWSQPDDGLIVNVGPLKGSQVTNAVPEYAACWGNIRFEKPGIGEEVAHRLQALATSEDAMPRVKVHVISSRPAKPRTEAVEKLASLICDAGKELGQDIPQVATGGVCDGNLLQDEGLPTIDTMGIRGGNLHRLDEYIEVDSFVPRTQLLALVLARLAALKG